MAVVIVSALQGAVLAAAAARVGRPLLLRSRSPRTLETNIDVSDAAALADVVETWLRDFPLDESAIQEGENTKHLVVCLRGMAMDGDAMPDITYGFCL